MIRQIAVAFVLAAGSILHAGEADVASEAVVVSANAREELVGLAGKTVTVEGKARVGSTSGGGITFFNMASGPDAFKAVAFKAAAAAFPEGFDKYNGKTLRVTGKIELFKETTPQIVISAPDQIEIVADAAADGAAEQSSE